MIMNINKLRKGKKLNPVIIANHYKSLSDINSEFIIIHYLDSKGKNISVDIFSINEKEDKLKIINLASRIHKNNAASIIIMHSNKDGSSIASTTDINTTKKIYTLCDTLEIDFMDYIIVGRSNWYSFRDNEQYNYITNNKKINNDLCTSTYKFIDISDKLLPKKIKFSDNDNIAEYCKNFNFKRGKDIIFLYHNNEGDIFCADRLEFGKFFPTEIDQSTFAKRLLDLEASGLTILSNMPTRMSIDQWYKNISFTRNFIEVCNSIGAEFNDHLSLGSKKYFSFNNQQILRYGEKLNEEST